jgi:hypothetical protein
MSERQKLGKPEEESAASSSTQSASGLGGGTPEGQPSRGRDMEREERGRERVGGERPGRTDKDNRTAEPEKNRKNPTLPDDDSPLRTEI